jgi:hypothetical protein
MSAEKKQKPTLDPEAPGLDEETRMRRRILQEMQKMTNEERFQAAVDAGILTPDGRLTPPYANPEPYEYGPQAGLILDEVETPEK